MAAEVEGECVRVEVVYALPERQALMTLTVAAGTTVQEVIDRSGIREQFPDQDLDGCAVGIWGQRVERYHRLRDGDRIELYRPLAIEPREARRRLASSGRTMGRHDDD